MHLLAAQGCRCRLRGAPVAPGAAADLYNPCETCQTSPVSLHERLMGRNASPSERQPADPPARQPAGTPTRRHVDPTARRPDGTPAAKKPLASSRAFTYSDFSRCGHGSVGRAPPCQGGGRGFEPRCPLHAYEGPAIRSALFVRRRGQVVRHGPAKPLPPVRVWASPPELRAARHCAGRSRMRVLCRVCGRMPGA